MKKVLFVLFSVTILSLLAVFYAKEQKTPLLQFDLAQGNGIQERVFSIENEINQLKADVREIRLKAMDAEVTAQPMMLSDWDSFTQKGEESKRRNETVQRLKKRIHELILLRQELLSQSDH